MTRLSSSIKPISTPTFGIDSLTFSYLTLLVISFPIGPENLLPEVVLPSSFIIKCSDFWLLFVVKIFLPKRGPSCILLYI